MYKVGDWIIISGSGPEIESSLIIGKNENGIGACLTSVNSHVWNHDCLPIDESVINDFNINEKYLGKYSWKYNIKSVDKQILGYGKRPGDKINCKRCVRMK